MSSQTLPKCWCGIRHPALCTMEASDPDMRHHRAKLALRRSEKERRSILLHHQVYTPGPVDEWLAQRLGTV